MSDLTPIISVTFSIPFSNISERVSLGKMGAFFTNGNLIRNPSMLTGQTRHYWKFIGATTPEPTIAA